jgi:hypothetical protein
MFSVFPGSFTLAYIAGLLGGAGLTLLIQGK